MVRYVFKEDKIMSSSSASTTETVRRKAASRYLGSSLVEREPIVQQRNLSVENIVRIGQPVFKIEEEDIEFGNMDAHYSFTNSNNVAEHGNSFSRKFGLNILNIIDINYNKKEQNKDVRKEQGTVVSVVCSQIVSIREKDLRNLKKIIGNVD